MTDVGDLSAPLVRARGVGFTWPDGTAALQAVDLEVRRGEVLGLLGPNGSGKTTLVRVLSTASRPDEGRVELFPGAPDLSPRAIRRRTAVVFDRAAALEALPGRENLTRLLALRGRRAEAARASADRWLDAFGLGPARERPVGHYSLGMRRKLALAEAFAAEPCLLLLDEPLIGLDPPGRAALAAELRGRSGAGGAAVLALHDAAFARRACDRVLFLHEGRVAADGTPAGLIGRLGGETVFEVETASPPPTGEPPDALRLLGRAARMLRVGSPSGSAALSALCAWLVEAGADVRAVRVREPGLDDVYLALTGRPLEGGDGAPGEAGGDAAPTAIRA